MSDFDFRIPAARPRTHLLAPRRSGAGVALLLLACLAQASAAQTTAPTTTPPASETKLPKLTVDAPVHETGEVARDRVIEHTWALRNTGDAPLLIENVIVPPNLQVISRPESIAPGTSGDLKVRVPLLNDKALALLKQILVKSNDPSSPQLTLELKILSTEYVSAKPGYARWISVQHEKPGTISQIIAAKDGSAIEVLETTAPPDGVTSALAVSARTESGAAKEWKLDLTLAVDAEVGPILGTMLVSVNHPKQSTVPIPLSGFMRPVLAVTPNTLSVGEQTVSEKRAQAFTVKSFSTEPVRVIKVEHDLPGFAPVSVEERQAGREYRLKLEFDPALLQKGPFRGTLKIHTDSTKVPLLTVPIDGTIQ